MFYSCKQSEASCHVFSAVSHTTRIAGTRGPMCSFAMSIYSGDDVLKSFRNLLQGGDRTSAKKLDEDLDILWGSKGGNVDLSKWSKDDFSTGLITDYLDCEYFAGKPVATNNFGLCFTAKEKFYRNFLATTFFHLVIEKKNFGRQLALPKKVHFGPCALRS